MHAYPFEGKGLAPPALSLDGSELSLDGSEPKDRVDLWAWRWALAPHGSGTPPRVRDVSARPKHRHAISGHPHLVSIKDRITSLGCECRP